MRGCRCLGTSRADTAGGFSRERRTLVILTELWNLWSRLQPVYDALVLGPKQALALSLSSGAVEGCYLAEAGLVNA